MFLNTCLDVLFLFKIFSKSGVKIIYTSYKTMEFNKYSYRLYIS